MQTDHASAWRVCVSGTALASSSTNLRSCARTRSEHRISNVKEEGFERRATYENVFPNRRGVEMRISDGVVAQPLRSLMSGSDLAQSFLYTTRLVARKNAS